MEVATSKGLPHLKHHLLPRTKGFTLLCNAVNNRIEWLYDITLAIPKANGTQKPSLKLIKDGVPIDFQIYIRRIPLSSVPLDEKTSAEWLQKLYQEKVGIFKTNIKKIELEELYFNNVTKRVHHAVYHWICSGRNC